MSAQFTPEQIDAWANAMLDAATDEMYDKGMDITPETLSTYFEANYDLPFTPDEAGSWLSEQDWYQEK